MSDNGMETMVDNIVKTTASLIGENFTIIDKSQPLNVIRGESVMEICNVNDSVTLNEWDPSATDMDKHGIICEICEIPRFTGSCDGCGIYQYCSGQFNDNDQFEIFGIRRINNGVSTEPSDVESDS